MKKTILTLLAAAVTAATSSAATTILIDYNDGVPGGEHDSAVRNGGFETNGLPGSSNYATGSNWTNNGNSSSTTALYSVTFRTGGAAGIVSLASVPTNSTAYIIAEGDVIDLSFWTRSNNTTSYDIAWHFGEITGSAFTDFATNGTATVTATGTYQTFSGSKTVGAGDALIGKSLALQFTRVSSAGFPVVDDVFLSVTPVPEPSSTVLLGLGVLALAFRRRK